MASYEVGGLIKHNTTILRVVGVVIEAKFNPAGGNY
jgi:hypothetical protein